MQYKTSGVCSRSMEVEIDDNGIVTKCAIVGGCNGNTQGLSKLVLGRKAEDVISLLEGTQCGMRGTSCPDQLSKALRLALAEKA